MKKLLKEVEFVLNSLPRKDYHYDEKATDTYKLVIRVGEAINGLNETGADHTEGE